MADPDTPAPVVHDFTDRAVRTARLFRGNNFVAIRGGVRQSAPLDADGTFTVGVGFTADIAIVTGDLPAPNGVFDFTESASRRSSARFRGPTRVIQQRTRRSLSAVDGTLGMTLSFSSAISVIRPVAATFGMGVSFTATDTIVGVAGNVFVWNGTSWVPADLFVWNGSSWVAATASTWNGSLWI